MSTGTSGTRPKSWLWVSLIGVAVIVVGGLIVMSQGSSNKDPLAAAAAPSTHTLTGTLSVPSGAADGCFPGASAAVILAHLYEMVDGKTFPCESGPGGEYSDIASGTVVTVKDASAKTIALASLSGGVLGIAHVIFDFKIDKIPNSDFYEVTVADRGGTSFSAERLKTAGWVIALTV